jgi:hypothetical protein
VNAPVRHAVIPGADVRQETAPAAVAAPLDAPVIYIDLDSLDPQKRSSDFRSSFSAWEAGR